MAFEAFPKIPRFREMIVSEKIDGTYAAVVIEETNDGRAAEYGNVPTLCVQAQSRKRIVTPGNDNYGFASWVYDNAEALVSILGPGRHSGEWWGKGIRRGYGMDRKVFSLFNTKRWNKASLYNYSLPLLEGLDVVPVLYTGDFGTSTSRRVMWELEQKGSVASPGFMNPEGIVIYQPNSNRLTKMTIDGDKGKYVS